MAHRLRILSALLVTLVWSVFPFVVAMLTRFLVDKVLLVGGSTRMPAVQDKVRALFGKEPSKDIDPDKVVAMGAAVQGAVMAGEVKDMVLQITFA